MACFIASVARGETLTQPHLVHEPNRPRQKTDPIGIPAASYQALLRGMEQTVTSPKGTGRSLNSALLKIPGLRTAGKTGTAQVSTPKGKLNLAWFICYAPVERPEIAIAVMIEGDTPNEELGGGRYAVPVAQGILKTWWEKKQQTLSKPLTVSQSN